MASLPKIGAMGRLLECPFRSGWAVIDGTSYPARTHGEELDTWECMVVGHDGDQVIVAVPTAEAVRIDKSRPGRRPGRESDRTDEWKVAMRQWGRLRKTFPVIAWSIPTGAVVGVLVGFACGFVVDPYFSLALCAVVGSAAGLIVGVAAQLPISLVGLLWRATRRNDIDKEVARPVDRDGSPPRNDPMPRSG